MTVQRAINELGMAAACESFGQSPDSDVHALAAAVLTTVYQATRNSSPTTRGAARDVAQAIGATHIELDVGDVCDSYTRKTEVALGCELTWETDDIALQNIQARSRAPSVWMAGECQERPALGDQQSQ